MAAFTGLRLNFGKNEDDEPKIIFGEAILPHRVDIIEARLDRLELSGLDEMFFNYKVPNCKNETPSTYRLRENQAFEKYLRITAKLIDFPGMVPGVA